MRDLRQWMVKRLSWRMWSRDMKINGMDYVPRYVAEHLFAERERMRLKLAKERARRNAAIQELHDTKADYLRLLREKQERLLGEHA